MGRYLRKAYTLLYWMIQWTWGIPQNLMGLLLFLIYHKKPEDHYKGTIITTWEKPTSLSLGMFLFLAEDSDDWLIMHEYGHSLQSLILGPMYLMAVGLPSIIWCNAWFFINYRTKRHISYYSFYTERWANRMVGISERTRKQTYIAKLY